MDAHTGRRIIHTHTDALALAHQPTHTCTHALRSPSQALLRCVARKLPAPPSVFVFSPRTLLGACAPMLRWACLTGVESCYWCFFLKQSRLPPRGNTSVLPRGTCSVPEDALHKASDVGVFGVMEGEKWMLLRVEESLIDNVCQNHQRCTYISIHNSCIIMNNSFLICI